MMETYQNLKNLCTIWMLITITLGAFVIIVGVIALINENLIGVVYIGGVLMFILASAIFNQLVLLFIDIAQGIQSLNERRSKTPPQLR